MTIIPKALVGAVAAGAMAIVPNAANAQYRDYNRGGGISVGDIIAGAVVLGGIAAVASSIGRGGNYRSDERYYRNGSYGYYNGDPRAAVEQCVSAANNDARSRGYRYAQVTQVRNVDDTNYGWKIKGNLQVDGNGGYYQNSRYDDRYNNNGYYNNGRYGYQRADTGSFTCWIDRGRVSRMDYSGIRNM
ncbi:MAG: hypothetical protein EOP59_16915 [Sphingomonadales bacterium]|nr:MAG: hypothetical protein EOP59_16915 [Sphingomonadales bacterium]